jgi:hypothetical protein
MVAPPPFVTVALGAQPVSSDASNRKPAQNGARIS